MSKQLSSCKEIKVIDEHVHIKGNLLVDGKIASLAPQEALVVTRQRDLYQKIFSSFVPILIPAGVTYNELILDLPHLYNRHLQILNLSGHTIQLVVPINSVQQRINLPNNRHANVTIFATCKLVQAAVDIPANPGDLPGPAVCNLSFNLGSLTLDEYALQTAAAIDNFFYIPPNPDDPNPPVTLTTITKVPIPLTPIVLTVLTTTQSRFGNSTIIGVTILDQIGNIVNIRSDNPTICSIIQGPV